MAGGQRVRTKCHGRVEDGAEFYLAIAADAGIWSKAGKQAVHMAGDYFAAEYFAQIKDMQFHPKIAADLLKGAGNFGIGREECVKRENIVPLAFEEQKRAKAVHAAADSDGQPASGGQGRNSAVRGAGH